MQNGISCLLAEAETGCSGVTRNTTAKITSQHGVVYSGLIRRFGVERAQMYLNANESALQEYRALCAEINCDFEEKDSFVYSLNGREKSNRSLTHWKSWATRRNLQRRCRCPFRSTARFGFRVRRSLIP